MSVMYRPAKPMPSGYRHYHDGVTEIATAEGWTPTGFCFGYEPAATEIERIARELYSNRHMGYDFPVDALHVRKIEHDGLWEAWTVFRSAPRWHEV